MWKAKLITIVLICGLSITTGSRLSTSQTVAQQPANNKTSRGEPNTF